jgi:hypothetical protein
MVVAPKHDAVQWLNRARDISPPMQELFLEHQKVLEEYVEVLQKINKAYVLAKYSKADLIVVPGEPSLPKPIKEETPWGDNVPW